MYMSLTRQEDTGKRLQRVLHVASEEAYRCDLHTLSSKEAIEAKCIFITVSACNISSPPKNSCKAT